MTYFESFANPVNSTGALLFCYSSVRYSLLFDCSFIAFYCSVTINIYNTCVIYKIIGMPIQNTVPLYHVSKE